MYLQSKPSKARVVVLVTSIALSLIIFSIHYFLRHSITLPLIQSEIATQVATTLHPKWLIATISNANHLQRRSIIRSTWQTLFRNATPFETRFVISQPDPLWSSLIEQENTTYGDIIMLPHLEETHHIANTIKTLEFFKHLITENYHWDILSKMDEDSFIDARNFYKEWLHPLLNTENPPPQKIYIGRPMQLHYPFKYASGQFYTLSWDMITLLSQLHNENPIDDEHEDVLLGRLMHEANIAYNVTELPLRAAFDYYDDKTRGDGTAWAPEDQNVDVLGHALAPGALNPHLLKEEEDYLKVAGCYNSLGLDLNSYNSYHEEGPLKRDYN